MVGRSFGRHYDPVMPGDPRTDEILTAAREHAVFTASRAGGPGGQHVNTSSTRAEVRVPLTRLPLSEAERARVRARLGGRMTAEDEIRVAIGTERSQLMNRRRAEEVLAELVDDARRADRPRRPTRPTRASKERRRAEKKHRSRIKADRARRPEPD